MSSPCKKRFLFSANVWSCTENLRQWHDAESNTGETLHAFFFPVAQMGEETALNYTAVETYWIWETWPCKNDICIIVCNPIKLIIQIWV